ncbi:hypothetical protein J437_LFUL004632 [Ladona fulva]|uniref:Mre11 DNA-binding domain-containing protein n=1 Tax=Ladona fulva TaxID=123851 RepID=A0A8K0JZ28_LADFU|nr:hypothetical protein J437_LFUL004632 [Ladona fulva]
MFNQARVGQHFADQVANPGDMILLKRAVGRKVKEEFDELDPEALFDATEYAKKEQHRLEEMQVESIVIKYFAGVVGNEDESTLKKRKNLNKGRMDAGFDDDMDDDIVDISTKRGGARGRGRGRGRGKKEPVVINVSDVDSDAETQQPIQQKPAPRGRGRGRGGRGKNAPQNHPQLTFLQKSSDSFMSSPKTTSRSRFEFISSDED